MDPGQIIKSWENRLDQEHCYALIQLKNIVKEETKAPLKQVIVGYFFSNKRLSGEWPPCTRGAAYYVMKNY